MKITLSQKDINTALEKHIISNLNLTPDRHFSIRMVPIRGTTDMEAHVELYPVGHAPSAVNQPAVTSAPTSRKPRTVKEPTVPVTEAQEELPLDTPEVTSEDKPVEEAPVVAEEETVAPNTGKKSLFGNLGRPDNRS